MLLGDFDGDTSPRRMILDSYGHSEAVFDQLTLRRRDSRRMFLWDQRDALVEQRRDAARGRSSRKPGAGHERCIQWRP